MTHRARDDREGITRCVRTPHHPITPPPPPPPWHTYIYPQPTSYLRPAEHGSEHGASLRAVAVDRLLAEQDHIRCLLVDDLLQQLGHWKREDGRGASRRNVQRTDAWTSERIGERMATGRDRATKASERIGERQSGGGG